MPTVSEALAHCEVVMSFLRQQAGQPQPPDNPPDVPPVEPPTQPPSGVRIVKLVFNSSAPVYETIGANEIVAFEIQANQIASPPNNPPNITVSEQNPPTPNPGRKGCFSFTPGALDKPADGAMFATIPPTTGTLSCSFSVGTAPPFGYPKLPLGAKAYFNIQDTSGTESSVQVTLKSTTHL